MDWAQLDHIGPVFTKFLLEVFKSPRIFYNAFETEQEAEAILIEALGPNDPGVVSRMAIQELMEWRNKAGSAHNRLVNLTCLDSFSHVKFPCTHIEKTLQDDFEEIVKDGPGFILDLAKRRVKRKLEAKGSQRAEIEREQRELYALQMAEIIREACLPVVFQLDVLQDPNKAWVRIFGSRRSKTLRNRLKAWKKFRDWLSAFTGDVWPKTLAPLIAYIEEKINDGCSLSCPKEFHASLTILEQIGRVSEDKRFSNDPTWMSHMASWKLELESGTRPPKAAKPYSFAILLSLEIFVQDTSQDLYLRFIAWVMLVASWTALRVDDIQGVLPETLRLSKRGFSARLSRSKTTGAGKLHGQLAIFIHREVTLSGIDWMQIGMSFTTDESFIYPRDYLVPQHNDNWTAFYPKLVEPPALANLMRLVLGRIGTPRYQDSWRSNMAMLLVPDDLKLFWTGHSARHVLNQAALVLGVPKDQRDYLGRWCIGRVGSNAYIHTARQVVEDTQMRVVRALLEGQGYIDESELLDEIAQFADEHGLIGHRIRRRHAQNFRRGFEPLVLDEEDTDNEQKADEIWKADVETELSLEENTSQTSQSNRYFVTVSRRTGLRRLHAYHRCPVTTQRCLETFDVSSIDDSTFDAMCRICKRRLQADEGQLESEESSSSGDSSSTESAGVETDKNKELEF